MIRFENPNQTWWRKPLVIFAGRVLPAELAVLRMELRTGEEGVWLNSRGFTSGVRDIVAEAGRRKTSRVPLPAFVAELLRRVMTDAKVQKGIPDLAIWNEGTEAIRLVEVKCPHWDRPSPEQEAIFSSAEDHGIEAKVVEWEFNEGAV